MWQEADYAELRRHLHVEIPGLAFGLDPYFLQIKRPELFEDPSLLDEIPCVYWGDRGWWSHFGQEVRDLLLLERQRAVELWPDEKQDITPFVPWIVGRWVTTFPINGKISW